MNEDDRVNYMYGDYDPDAYLGGPITVPTQQTTACCDPHTTVYYDPDKERRERVLATVLPFSAGVEDAIVLARKVETFITNG